MRLEELWLRDNKLCQLCLEEVEYSEASRDHIVPRWIAYAKRMSSPNGAANLQLAHKSCNVYRGVKALGEISVEDFKKQRAKYIVSRIGKPDKQRCRPKRVKQQPENPVKQAYRSAEVRRRVWRCNFCGGNSYSDWRIGVHIPFRVCEICGSKQFDNNARVYA